MQVARPRCPACSEALAAGPQKGETSCPHCGIELVVARSGKLAVGVLATLLIAMALVLMGLRGQQALVGFLILYLPCACVAALIVRWVLPARYAIKPGQVPKLFR